MTRVGLANLVAATAAVGLSLAAVALGAPRHAPAANTGREAAAEVVDAGGMAVAVRPYRRIASLGMVSDGLLLALCEPERVVACTTWGGGPDAWRLAGKARLPGLDDLEGVIALRPDLVLVSTFGGQVDRVRRLRQAGLAVFDLGDARGVVDLLPAARAIASLIGHPERGERFVAGFERRLAAISARLPADGRRSALYVAVHADRLSGGTTGTSYADIIAAAGLRDAAAGRYAGWPSYSIEQVLALDPDLVITRSGMGGPLRRLPGLEALPALRDPLRTIELDAHLLESPGVEMLEAAELLHHATHPPR